MSTTKNTASKFTFDTDFLGAENRPAPAARARQKQTLTAEELENLLAAARREGEKSAQAALDTSHAEMEALRNDAACLALAMAKKIAPAALAALPAGDVEAAVRQAMHQAIGEPRIILRATPAVVEVLEPRLAGIAHEEGYEGRVQIAPDPAMTGADCRIEWRGGGAERSESTIEDALTALIAQHFSHPVKG